MNNGRKLFLYNLLNETLTLKNINKKILHDYGLNSDMDYFIIHIKLSNEFAKQVDYENTLPKTSWKKSFNDSIIKQVSEIPSTSFIDVLHLEPYTRTLFFDVKQNKPTESLEFDIKKSLTFLTNILNKQFHSKAIYFITPVVKDLLSLSNAYKKMRIFSNYQFILGMGSVNFCRTLKIREQNMMLPHSIFNEYRNALFNHNLTKSLDLLSLINKQLLESFSTNSKSEYIYKELLSITNQYLYDFAEYDLTRIRDINHKIVNFNNSFNDLSEAHTFIIKQLNEIHQSQQEIETPYNHYTLKALKKIDYSYHQPITLRDCANTLNISEAYLSRLFRSDLGMNFRNYLIQKRITEAKILLKTTDLPINQIAKKVGYDTPNSFNRAFKKIEGYPPSNYR